MNYGIDYLYWLVGIAFSCNMEYVYLPLSSIWTNSAIVVRVGAFVVRQVGSRVPYRATSAEVRYVYGSSFLLCNRYKPLSY